MSERVYLDFNASAPVKPEVTEAVAAAMRLGGNASSVHGEGRAARQRIEEARDSLCQLLGCAPGEVIFTSGGTEANNLALGGVDAASVMVSAIEHDSVLAAAQASGKPWRTLAVDAAGLVLMEELEAVLEASVAPVLVSIMLANNETGVIQPISKIADLIHSRGGILHTDAIQAVGKIPLDFATLGADLLSLSGHKMGGPQGVGALIVRPGVGLRALMVGGGQEMRRRSGTENMPAIAGLGVAAELALDDIKMAPRIEKLRDGLEMRMQKLCGHIRFFSKDAARLPNTANFTMPGVRSEIQVMALDLEGVAVSAGAACSSGKVTTSRVLLAMGASEEEAASGIRVSLGPTTSGDHVDRLVGAWRELWERKCAANSAKAAAG
ncbi:MAG: cysteine desulfurase family protein [Sphingomonadales bacterium]